MEQYSKVTYLGCELDESLSGEAMALNVINKINGRLKLLYRKNRYLTLYFPMFPLDPPENIRKPSENVFRGIKSEHWEVKG